MLGVKRHLNSTDVAGDTKEDAVYISPNSYVAARTIHMVGRDILIFVICCKDGDIGACMEHVAKVTMNGKLPYLIIGDLNHPPKVLMDSIWGQKHEGQGFAG